MGRLDVRQISRTWVDLDNVLSVGEQLQVLVHKIYPHRDLVLVSTSVLERNQGDMLTNRQAVWDGAEEMAVQWRAQQEVKQAKLASKRQRRGGRVEAVLAAVKVRGLFVLEQQHCRAWITHTLLQGTGGAAMVAAAGHVHSLADAWQQKAEQPASSTLQYMEHPSQLERPLGCNSMHAR
jgi:hypothetical protein